MTPVIGGNDRGMGGGLSCASRRCDFVKWMMEGAIVGKEEDGLKEMRERLPWG